MRLGISSYTYSWAVGVAGYPPPVPMSAKALLNRAAQLQVGVVQIADNLPLDKLTDDDITTIGRQAQEMGITLEVGTRGIAPGHLRQYLALAQRLSSSILRVVIDTPTHHPEQAEIVSTLRTLESEFSQAEVTLAIENHDRFRAAELRAIVELLGDWAGVCLDTVNSFGALEGPGVVVDTLGPHTVNLHVKDFTIHRAGHQMGFAIEGSAAGQGRLDIPWLLRTLSAQGRDPNAILELWTPPAANPEETIAIEQRWAKESVQYLRTLIEK